MTERSLAARFEFERWLDVPMYSPPGERRPDPDHGRYPVYRCKTCDMAGIPTRGLRDHIVSDVCEHRRRLRELKPEAVLEYTVDQMMVDRGWEAYVGLWDAPGDQWKEPPKDGYAVLHRRAVVALDPWWVELLPPVGTWYPWWLQASGQPTWGKTTTLRLVHILEDHHEHLPAALAAKRMAGERWIPEDATTHSYAEEFLRDLARMLDPLPERRRHGRREDWGW